MLDIPAIEKIKKLEHYLLQLPQVDMPVTHEFCEGLYIRTMKVTAGTVLTGAIHRGENFLFIREGDITVWTSEGMRHLFNGDLVKSNAGLKRVGYTHTDCIMSTIHFNPTNETDPEMLWEIFTVPDFATLDAEATKYLEAL